MGDTCIVVCVDALHSSQHRSVILRSFLIKERTNSLSQGHNKDTTQDQ